MDKPDGGRGTVPDVPRRLGCSPGRQAARRHSLLYFPCPCGMGYQQGLALQCNITRSQRRAEAEAREADHIRAT